MPELQLRVEADYGTLYDQAGLMVRVDERRWLKAGIEWSDGTAMLSSVLTMDRSDWATAPYGHPASPLWLRVTVETGVLRLQSGRHDAGSDQIESVWRDRLETTRH